LLKQNIEILAPAGNYEKMETAVRFGANAVYLSGKNFGMRAYSGNFSDEELQKAVLFCKENNVKLYVTINIIAHNSDLEGLVEYITFLDSIKIDAVIVADFGILEVIKRTAPTLPIHISTQFSAMNYETYNFLKKLGAERVVLPRELSRHEIKEISQHSDLELEGFVHGAMCMGYSGRCMISDHTKNRDANRGQCNQPCRYGYKLVTNSSDQAIEVEEEEGRGSYFFNSKDLCLIEHIPEVIKAGVTSLKIEGRMKTLSYLSTVVKVYREAVDRYLEDPENYQTDPEWMTELLKVSNRGYTTFRFLDKNTTEETQGIESSRAVATHDIIAIVKEIVDKTYMVVEVKTAFVPGQQIDIVIPGKRVLSVTINNIKDVLGREISRTNPNQIVLLRHFKSVVPGSILRAKKE